MPSLITTGSLFSYSSLNFNPGASQDIRPAIINAYDNRKKFIMVYTQPSSSNNDVLFYARVGEWTGSGLQDVKLYTESIAGPFHPQTYTGGVAGKFELEIQHVSGQKYVVGSTGYQTGSVPFQKTFLAYLNYDSATNTIMFPSAAYDIGAQNTKGIGIAYSDAAPNNYMIVAGREAGTNFTSLIIADVTSSVITPKQKFYSSVATYGGGAVTGIRTYAIPLSNNTFIVGVGGTQHLYPGSSKTEYMFVSYSAGNNTSSVGRILTSSIGSDISFRMQPLDANSFVALEYTSSKVYATLYEISASIYLTQSSVPTQIFTSSIQTTVGLGIAYMMITASNVHSVGATVNYDTTSSFRRIDVNINTKTITSDDSASVFIPNSYKAESFVPIAIDNDTLVSIYQPSLNFGKMAHSGSMTKFGLWSMLSSNASFPSVPSELILNKTYIPFRKGVEYQISAFVLNGDSITDVSASPSIQLYITNSVASDIVFDTINCTPYGYRVGYVDLIQGSSVSTTINKYTPSYVSENFIAEYSGTGSLQLKMVGNWYFSNVSIKPFQDTNFSAQEFSIIVPNPSNRNENISLVSEFVGGDGQTVGDDFSVSPLPSFNSLEFGMAAVDATAASELTPTPNASLYTVVTGSNTVIMNSDNIIEGDLWVSKYLRGGVQISGQDNAMVRSVGYQGYGSASRMQGFPGFMLFSGSVLPTVYGDTKRPSYAGVGLEMHAGGDSGSFRFRADTTGSFIEIITQDFFLGNSSSSYISGSGGILVISSSNFFLSSSGDVYISGTINAPSGNIGGFTITPHTLQSEGAPLAHVEMSSSAIIPGIYIYDDYGLRTKIGLHPMSDNGGWGINSSYGTYTVIDACTSTVGWTVLPGATPGFFIATDTANPDVGPTYIVFNGLAISYGSASVQTPIYTPYGGLTVGNTYNINFRSNGFGSDVAVGYAYLIQGSTVVSTVRMSASTIWNDNKFAFTAISTDFYILFDVSGYTFNFSVDDIKISSLMTTTNITQNGLYIDNNGISKTQIGAGVFNVTASGNFRLYGNSYFSVIDVGKINININGLNGVSAGIINAIGSHSRQSNTAFGYSVFTQPSLLTGIDNTAIGYAAMEYNTDGYLNTAVGYAALNSNTTGHENTAIGRSALTFNTTGNYNVAVGNALQNNIDGYSNISIGWESLKNNLHGNEMVAIGQSAGGAMSDTWDKTIGNIFIGYQSGLKLTTGRNNIFVGHKAGFNMTNGNNNVIIGEHTGSIYDGTSNNIILADGNGHIGLRIDNTEKVYVYNMQINSGSMDGYVLTSDGAGNTRWGPAGGSSAGSSGTSGTSGTSGGGSAASGSAGWIQYSDGAGNLGGNSNLTFNSSSKALSVTGSLIVSGGTILITAPGMGGGLDFAIGNVSSKNRIQSYASDPYIRLLDIDNGYASVGIRSLTIGKTLASVAAGDDNLIVAGNATISGSTFISGSIQIPSGSSINYVLTSDAAGNARWASANTIVGMYNPAHVKYVSPDFTSSADPYYSTIQSAITAAVISSSLIVVYPGTYNNGVILLKNAVDLYCYQGVTLKNDTAGVAGIAGSILYDTTSSVVCTVYGHADIIKHDSVGVQNEANAILIINPYSNVTIYANKVTSDSWSAFGVFGSGTSSPSGPTASLYCDTIIGYNHIAVDCDSAWMHCEAREIYGYYNETIYCMVSPGVTTANKAYQYVKASNIILSASDSSKAAIYNYGAGTTYQEIQGNVYASMSVCSYNNGTQYLANGTYHTTWNNPSANVIYIQASANVTTLENTTLISDNISANGIYAVQANTPVVGYGRVVSNRINSSNVSFTNGTPYQAGVNFQGNVNVSGSAIVSGSTIISGSIQIISGSAAGYILTSDASGIARWSPNSVVSSYNAQNVKYVSPIFTSSFDPYYPTIQSALTAATVSGSLIVVYPGIYNDGRVPLKNAVDLYCYPDVTIRNDNTGIPGVLGCVMTDVSNSVSCSVWGHANIIKTEASVLNEACAVMVFCPNSNIIIHANRVESNSWAAFGVYGGGSSCSGTLYADTIVGYNHIAVDCDSAWQHVEAREIYGYYNETIYCMVSPGVTTANKAYQYVKASNIILSASDSSKAAIYNYGGGTLASSTYQEIHGNVYAYNSICAQNGYNGRYSAQYLADGIYHCYWNSAAENIYIDNSLCATTLDNISVIIDNASAQAISAGASPTFVTAYRNVSFNQVNNSNVILVNGAQYQAGTNFQGNISISGSTIVSGSLIVSGTIQIPAGASVGYVLTSDAGGIGHWSSSGASGTSGTSGAGGVLASGSAGWIQYSTGAGNLGANSNFSFISSSKILSITGSVVVSGAIQITSGSAASYIMLSDASGNALWTPSSSVSVATSSYVTSFVVRTPTDGTYSDGFFDTWVPTTTTVSDALDQISTAFLSLAPVRAGTLANMGLVSSSMTFYSGRLAAGLNSNYWYVSGASANSLVSTLVISPNVTLNTSGSGGTNPVIFRAGKASDILATLTGGVSASRATGSSAYYVTSSRALSSGAGVTGAIKINGVSAYNTFWAEASASIIDVIATTGSNTYFISADNGAGASAIAGMWYVGTIADYPNVVITNTSSSTSASAYNYLSGVSYYKTATIFLDTTASGVFNPVYTDANQISYASAYFTTINSGSATPSMNDTLSLQVKPTINANLNSAQTSGSYTITITKPGKSNVTSTGYIGSQSINSYASAQSTNNANSQNETFFDEAWRTTTTASFTAFPSSSALVDGNLQVQNGRLICGRYGNNYQSFVSGSTSAATQYAIYYRESIPASNARIGGTFSFVRNANAFAASSPISQWGSGAGKLEICMVLTTQAGNIYDFGRAVGNNSGNIYGILSGAPTVNNTTTYTFNWAYPGGINTGTIGTDFVIIYVRYLNTASTDYISSMTVTYN